MLRTNIILLFFALVLSGCATVPPIDFTVQDVGIVNTRKNVKLVSLTVGFAPQAQQKRVESYPGLPQLPPIWKEALQDAINRALIFKDDGVSKINLSVRITETDLADFGLAMTTRVSAIYEIIDRANGDLLFAQEISNEAVIPMSYSLLGTVRGTESLNLAVRNNISDFINLLEVTDISQPVFLGTKN
ncbi:MAG: UDP-N-acetylglucosamine acyltransferase [Robiginitomaculum sp.]|nr:MAG: UDP-N-acetylglucosamine acyltransferase [Robiginitomaculum sp.]